MRRDSREHFEATHAEAPYRWPWYVHVARWALAVLTVAAGFVLGVEILVRI